ncbi:sulfatase [Vulcanisaeta moutnovskia 768-28]|uniref:Sulfatase n=1 Tax=Vulcanisaeta moutnovskia (strain 768-28) TaxID=985053 RepID=F0QXW4_VULM7|nr:sulfatase-like hydrolase/transferase [Vulcanisaeta moutnovskia]ADY01277.1 sulfatase [Vulcanisaeta moutnovskia 768-28]
MKRPNIIILVIDTLREDHSQGLNRLSELGFVKYENAIAPAPWTLPSHVSLITGLYPSQHGIHEGFSRTNEDLMHIATAGMSRLSYGLLGELRDYEYTTHIITANPYLSTKFGFKAYENVVVPGRFYSEKHLALYREWVGKYGRNRYVMFRDFVKNGRYVDAILGIIYSSMNVIEVLAHRLGVHDLSMEKGSRLITRIIEKRRFMEPFLLLINIMEAHSPYLPDDLGDVKYNNAISRWIIDEYVNDPIIERLRISYPRHSSLAVERAIGIVHALRPYLDNSLIIVTSDHGELLGDGGLGHGYFLKDGLLRVPLWIRWPSGVKPPKQAGHYVSLTQIPSIINNVINGDEVRVGSNLALSESFGAPPYMDYSKATHEQLRKIFSHRVRVYTRGCIFTYNVSMEIIEEGNCEEGTAKEIIKNFISLRPQPTT